MSEQEGLFDEPELFGECDAKGKIRSLPDRTGLPWSAARKTRTRLQRHLAGKIDPRLAQAKDILRQAIAVADLEALLWVIGTGVWWLTLEEAKELGTVLLKLLDGEQVA